MFFWLVFLISCKKDINNPVPNVHFDITIYFNLPSYSSLEGIGGWAYVDGGSKGIIVYRKSQDEFLAFDRHSPANDGICDKALEVDTNNFLQLNDLCSGAKFSLLDGSAISGANIGLRQYNTEFNGGNQLRIFN